MLLGIYPNDCCLKKVLPDLLRVVTYYTKEIVTTSNASPSFKLQHIERDSKITAEDMITSKWILLHNNDAD